MEEAVTSFATVALHTEEDRVDDGVVNACRENVDIKA